MHAPVASFECIAVTSNEKRFSVKVTIGAPYQGEKEPDVWRCPVSVDPLYPDLRDIAGDNSFQSLCLATRFAISLLQSFLENGGRLIYEGGNDVPLEAYVFLPQTR